MFIRAVRKGCEGTYKPAFLGDAVEAGLDSEEDAFPESSADDQDGRTVAPMVQEVEAVCMTKKKMNHKHRPEKDILSLLSH